SGPRPPPPVTVFGTPSWTPPPHLGSGPRPSGRNPHVPLTPAWSGLSWIDGALFSPENTHPILSYLRSLSIDSEKWKE
ncbi:unnamed protein product, partial [Gulo gulo]